MADLQNGRVTQVIGPVVDVAFPQGSLPAILTAIQVSNPAICEMLEAALVGIAQIAREPHP